MGCSSSTSLNGKKAELLEKSCLEVDFATDFFDHYSFDAKLGQGNFGQVRLINSLPFHSAASDDKVQCCAKVIDFRDKRRPGKECPALQALAAMEVRIAQQVGNHPNVVKLYGAYKEANLGFVVMEKCDSNLSEHMNSLPDINEKTLGKLLAQMFSSLHHLHSLRVVHRDVKPDNFLIGGPLGHTVKLCDFGLATILPAQGGSLRGRVGTSPFMCPEMCAGQSYDESADIWSLAVIVYVFLFGSFPYVPRDETDEGMLKAIVKGGTPTFESFDKRKKQPSPNASRFVRALLQKSAHLRTSAAESLTFPYMVMVMTGRHMKNVALPSLRPEFIMAHKIGAISSCNFSKRSSLDELLAVVQYKKLGVRMPQAWETHTSLDEKVAEIRQNKLSVRQDSCMLSTISEGTTCASPILSPCRSNTFPMSPDQSFTCSAVSPGASTATSSSASSHTSNWSNSTRFTL